MQILSVASDVDHEQVASLVTVGKYCGDQVRDVEGLMDVAVKVNKVGHREYQLPVVGLRGEEANSRVA